MSVLINNLYTSKSLYHILHVIFKAHSKSPTDKFYFLLKAFLGWSLVMMHVIDVVLDSFSNLFRFHRYSPREDLFCLSLHSGSKLKGSLREIRIWVHRFTSFFRPSRRVRRLVAIDETVLKVNGQTCYLLNCNCSTT
jgi:hypothetical protein